jgi:hypothetical protein
MGGTGTQPPELPFSFIDSRYQGPATDVPASTLAASRLAAVMCSAFGLALVAARLGWIGAIVAGLLLALHAERHDLALAWAEGPLLLGFGLCTATWGTRYFPIAAGIATTFKLTALPLWLVGFHKRANGGMWPLLAPVLAYLTWILLTPPSWFGGGPLFLIGMLVQRRFEYADQTAAMPGMWGLFLPSRYVWPLELGTMLALALAVRWAVHKRTTPALPLPRRPIPPPARVFLE